MADRTRIAGENEQREMWSMLEFLHEGVARYMQEKKKDGWVQLMFENWNSLGIFTHSWKLDHLNYLIHHLHLDVVLGCETECDWRFVDKDKQFLDILCPEMAKTGVATHTVNEHINREQMGGMAVAAVGHLSDVVTEAGQDHTGLAHYA